MPDRFAFVRAMAVFWLDPCRPGIRFAYYQASLIAHRRGWQVPSFPAARRQLARILQPIPSCLRAS